MPCCLVHTYAHCVCQQFWSFFFLFHDVSVCFSYFSHIHFQRKNSWRGKATVRVCPSFVRSLSLSLSVPVSHFCFIRLYPFISFDSLSLSYSLAVFFSFLTYVHFCFEETVIVELCHRRTNVIRWIESCRSYWPVLFIWILDKQYETMNRTLSDLRLSVLNDVNHLQKYETCREQSKCYLLAPPPRPPTIPELFLTSSTCQLSSANSPSILGNLRPRSDSSNLTIISIVVGLLIAMTSTCLILFLFGVK